jgi:predicted component of type VI protein secretion system
MAMNAIFGIGPTLREASPYLRDDEECIARILDVSERNSMIEGLPAFNEALRRSIRRDLERIFNGSAQAPR